MRPQPLLCLVLLGCGAVSTSTDGLTDSGADAAPAEDCQEDLPDRLRTRPWDIIVEAAAETCVRARACPGSPSVAIERFEPPEETVEVFYHAPDGSVLALLYFSDVPPDGCFEGYWYGPPVTCGDPGPTLSSVGCATAARVWGEPLEGGTPRAPWRSRVVADALTWSVVEAALATTCVGVATCTGAAEGYRVVHHLEDQAYSVFDVYDPDGALVGASSGPGYGAQVMLSVTDEPTRDAISACITGDAFSASAACGLPELVP